MIVEMKEEALLILEYSYPMIILSIIIASIIRIGYLKTSNEKFVLYKELLKLFFIIYILCMFHAVTYQDVSFSSANFTPFKEILRYDIKSPLFYKNILGNLLLFMPYGMILGYYIKTDKNYVIIILSAITSLSIEIIQLSIGRVFDVDDIILNIIGGLLGFMLYKLFKKVEDKLPNILKSEIVYNIVAILLVGGLIWFLIP